MAMTIRFEFDEINQILLARIDGQLTDEALSDIYRLFRRYSVLTDAKAGIFDLTGVTEFAVSSEFVRRLATTEPAMPKADERPRVVIAPQTHAFGLVRMFQIVGERTRPLFSAVKTMDEVLKVLRASTPDFKPIEF
jgi:hypothetical protein